MPMIDLKTEIPAPAQKIEEEISRLDLGQMANVGKLLKLNIKLDKLLLQKDALFKKGIKSVERTLH